MAAPVKLDVFGRRMHAERSGDGGRTYRVGADGKRAPVDVVAPDSLTEGGLVPCFDDLYHEAAAPRRPAVVRLP